MKQNIFVFLLVHVWQPQTKKSKRLKKDYVIPLRTVHSPGYGQCLLIVIRTMDATCLCYLFTIAMALSQVIETQNLSKMFTQYFVASTMLQGVKPDLPTTEALLFATFYGFI